MGGEQKAAKMSLILHGILNQDQYTMEDVYYPDWNVIFKDKTDHSDCSELSDETESDY